MHKTAVGEGKHTPGPWTVGERGSQSYKVTVPNNAKTVDAFSGREVAAEPTIIARVSAGPIVGEEAGAANVRLIAAAPELLNAVRIAQDLTDKWKRTEHGVDFHEVDRVLRLAISKTENPSND